MNMTQSSSRPALFQRKDDLSRGRHLVASQQISEGELIFVERPLVSLQSAGNAHEGSLCCRCCKAFIGGPDLCMMIASGRLSRQDVWDYYRENEEELIRGQESLKMFPCRHECGELYCSEECERTMWRGGHDLLCCGRISNHDDLHPLLEFKIFCMQTNEIFLMVADIISQAISLRRQQIEFNRNNDAEVSNISEVTLKELMAPYTDFTMVPWWDVVILPLMNDPSKVVESVELKKTLKELCKSAAALLDSALKSNVSYHQNDEIYKESLAQSMAEFESNYGINEDFVGQIIGSFEQNAIGIRARHPLCRDILEDNELRVRRHIELVCCIERAGMIGDDEEEDGEVGESEGEDEDKKEVEEKDIITDDNTRIMEEYSVDDITEFVASLPIDEGETNKAVTDKDEESPGDSLDALFMPLDGTSMFRTTCKMNHSCEPNVIVRYKYSCPGGGRFSRWGKDFPLVVQCVALREIERGEELCISYIANDAVFQERQQDLSNYGFQCECSKCSREINTKRCTVIPEAQSNDNDGVEEVDPFCDDLFGSDNEDDTENSVDEIEEPGPAVMQLIDKVRELDMDFAESAFGTIPISILAPALTFLFQVGSQVSRDLAASVQTEDIAIVGTFMKDLIRFVQDRNFLALCKAATEGENHSLVLLHRLNMWPHISMREAYKCFSVASAVCFAQSGNFSPAIQMLDKATIFGLELKRVQGLYQYIEHQFSLMNSSFHVSNNLVPRVIVQDYSEKKLRHLVAEIGLSSAIQNAVAEISAVDFISLKGNQIGAKPLVIRNYATVWPACQKWRHLHLFSQKYGTRIIPIEHGVMSDKIGMREEMMTMRTFIQSHLVPSTFQGVFPLSKNASNAQGNVAYLAQHQLFEQFPELMMDIIAPTHLCEKVIQINTWIGTGGTRTPLHFDTYDNLFVQVFGSKYVRLYDPKESSNLYVIKKGSDATAYSGQGNMSAVDCEREDYDQHPKSKNASFTEVVLFPGDCLYIPAKTWHYVRGLSTSASVNFWW